MILKIIYNYHYSLTQEYQQIQVTLLLSVILNSTLLGCEMTAAPCHIRFTVARRNGAHHYAMSGRVFVYGSLLELRKCVQRYFRHAVCHVWIA